jgi:hypothetical protein
MATAPATPQQAAEPVSEMAEELASKWVAREQHYAAADAARRPIARVASAGRWEPVVCGACQARLRAAGNPTLSDGALVASGPHQAASAAPRRLNLEAASPSELSLEERFELCRSVAEECIADDELRNLLAKKPNIIAYDGFEPSGRMHIAQVRLPGAASRGLPGLLLAPRRRCGMEFPLAVRWRARLSARASCSPPGGQPPPPGPCTDRRPQLSTRRRRSPPPAQGVMKAINVNKLTRAGCTFKFWVADWFAQLNNKMGGDLKKIQTVGRWAGSSRAGSREGAAVLQRSAARPLCGPPVDGVQDAAAAGTQAWVAGWRIMHRPRGHCGRAL